MSALNSETCAADAQESGEKADRLEPGPIGGYLRGTAHTGHEKQRYRPPFRKSPWLLKQPTFILLNHLRRTGQETSGSERIE